MKAQMTIMVAMLTARGIMTNVLILITVFDTATLPINTKKV